MQIRTVLGFSSAQEPGRQSQRSIEPITPLIWKGNDFISFFNNNILNIREKTCWDLPSVNSNSELSKSSSDSDTIELDWLSQLPGQCYSD